jgi:hypothetical protein
MIRSEDIFILKKRRLNGGIASRIKTNCRGIRQVIASLRHRIWCLKPRAYDAAHISRFFHKAN